jgi:Zn-dependent peptidase ImmA (M78 family)
MPLDSDLSGMIFDNGGVTIVVNSLHHVNRQRFTLAHELGHFELHMKEIGSAVHVDKKFLAFARGPKSSSGEDRREIEANSFASELLAPESMLAEELRGHLVDFENEDLIRGLAGKFQVSAQMMTFRVAAHVSGLQRGRSP